jgi:cytidylate kinase
VIANAIGKKYNLKTIHPSGVLRKLCEKQPIDIDKTEYNTGFWESKKGVKIFNDRLEAKEPLDIQATKIVINELYKGNVVVDSRDLPRLTNNGIKIYLKADMKIRAKRVSKRSNITYEQSMKILKMKYDKTRELFQKLYNIDITKNREVFDYILETDNLTEKEVCKKVCDFLEKRYPEFKK